MKRLRVIGKLVLYRFIVNSDDGNQFVVVAFYGRSCKWRWRQNNAPKLAAVQPVKYFVRMYLVDSQFVSQRRALPRISKSKPMLPFWMCKSHHICVWVRTEEGILSNDRRFIDRIFQRNGLGSFNGYGLFLYTAHPTRRAVCLVCQRGLNQTSDILLRDRHTMGNWTGQHSWLK